MALAPAPVLTFESLDSTNAEGRRRAEAGEGGPLWITAAQQSEGRGRRGRAWTTASGNLAATLLLTLRRPAAEVAQLSFVTALAVGDLAAAYAPPGSVGLKWPNDVLVNGLKVAGILIESGPAHGGGLWLAVGVGVNLASAPTGVEKPAAALVDFMARRPPSPADALQALRPAFARWFDVWDEQGFAPVREAWSGRAQGIGQSCQARLDNETIEGVAEGLDDDGALRLRLADGAVRHISAGDVFFAGGAR